MDNDGEEGGLRSVDNEKALFGARETVEEIEGWLANSARLELMLRGPEHPADILPDGVKLQFEAMRAQLRASLSLLRQVQQDYS